MEKNKILWEFEIKKMTLNDLNNLIRTEGDPNLIQ